MALADVTGLLLAWRDGDDAALTRLVPLVEQELHRIAQRHMAGERPGHSRQATALVNEAYLRLINVQRMDRQNRAQFLAMAARLLRRVLVAGAGQTQSEARWRQDHVGRSGSRHRRPDAGSGGARRCAAGAREDRCTPKSGHRTLLFRRPHVDETAIVLKVAPDTVMRDSRLAKAWVARELSGGNGYDA